MTYWMIYYQIHKPLSLGNTVVHQGGSIHQPVAYLTVYYRPVSATYNSNYFIAPGYLTPARLQPATLLIDAVAYQT